MDKQELEKFEKELIEDASSSLAASIEYLNCMLGYFDADTRKFYGLARQAMREVAKKGFKDGPEFTEWQIYERALIRALFAEIEGITAAMRQVVLWAHDRGEYSLSEIEYVNLAEKYRFNKLKDNFSLAFKYFTLLVNSQYSIDKSTSQWRTFLRSIKIRDGVMHPKTPLGFGVSGDASLDIEQTVHWFNETYRELIRSIPNAQVTEFL